jgi:hypothetical protein
VAAAVSTVAWQYVRPLVVSDRQYALDPRRIHITPPPPWIRADVRTEVLRDASLDRPLSILDEHLAERVATAFQFHPWVAEVRQVTKQNGPSVHVALVYRKPVLMVEIAGRDTPSLLPSDVEGVRLPDEGSSPAEKQQYPRLAGVAGEPLVGQRWSDKRVAGAARLAALLVDVWEQRQLARIVASPPPETDDDRHPSYELVARSGRRFLWGRAPGMPIPPDELPTSEKLSRLERLVNQYGSLEGSDTSEVLDLRRQPRTPSTSREVADQPTTR